MSVSGLTPVLTTITATGGSRVSEFPDYEAGVIYKVHEFSTSDDFVVTGGSGTVEYLLQAGGGGGGGQPSGSFGGSHGGGV